MTNQAETLLALDVGGRRIGVARADSRVRIAQPVATVLVDGAEVEKIGQWVKEIVPVRIVVGYPRNQAGEPTHQTEAVQRFAKRLEVFHIPIVFQDESLTSVIAERRLQERKKEYTKGMIDAEAAVIILQDYVELHYGH